LSGTITPFNDIAPHEKYMFHLASHFSESLTNDLIVKLQYKDAVYKTRPGEENKHASLYPASRQISDLMSR